MTSEYKKGLGKSGCHGQGHRIKNNQLGFFSKDWYYWIWEFLIKHTQGNMREERQNGMQRGVKVF